MYLPHLLTCMVRPNNFVFFQLGPTIKRLSRKSFHSCDISRYDIYTARLLSFKTGVIKKYLCEINDIFIVQFSTYIPSDCTHRFVRSYSFWMPLQKSSFAMVFNPLSPELNPICYLLAFLGAHHFLHVSRIRVRLLTFRLLMSYIWSTHS